MISKRLELLVIKREALDDKIRRTVKEILPVGKRVSVPMGNGMMNGVVAGYDTHKNPFEVFVKREYSSGECTPHGWHRHIRAIMPRTTTDK